VDVVPNGVDANYFTPDLSCRDSQPTVVFIGRLVWQKDPFLLIEAFSILRKLVPNARLIMIGKGYFDAKVQHSGRRNMETSLVHNFDLRTLPHSIRKLDCTSLGRDKAVLGNIQVLTGARPSVQTYVSEREVVTKN